ncbi:MAG: GDSL-type esterase/lipase family protein [Chitinophagales bacterium]|nr:GDSL-type esterase/lipase family protein [Chitinophagales bacterium]
MKIVLLFLFHVTLYTVRAQPCFPDSSIKIVVLGSSTTAGVGASVADSAWVNRYRVYLQSFNPNNDVINLGISATTTYQIMSDGFVPPIGRPAPNPNNNISKAIELQADAILVNMPSNDAFFGIDAETQMNNFKAIAHKADSAGIPIWIGTTQPRNLLPAQIQTQLSVRDSIFSYFGKNAIDFWTTIANTNNLPNPLYDSGDGIHLNDAGHKILFERVVHKNIPTQIMDTCMTVGMPDQTRIEIKIYPNPNNGSFTIFSGNERALEKAELSVLDLSGKEIFYSRITTYEFSITLPETTLPGVYLLHLNSKGSSLRKLIVVLD